LTLTPNIRDAEGPGLDASGAVNRASLTARGWRRAAALAASNLCGQLARPEAVRPVEFVVPSYVDRATGVDESACHRSYQTILSLALGAGTSPKVLCDRDKVEAILHHVDGFKGTSIVCWQHGGLVKLAALLAGDSAPTLWPHGRFDVLWAFHRHAGDSTYRWEQLDQELPVGNIGSR